MPAFFYARIEGAVFRFASLHWRDVVCSGCPGAHPYPSLVALAQDLGRRPLALEIVVDVQADGVIYADQGLAVGRLVPAPAPQGVLVATERGLVPLAALDLWGA